MKFFKRKLICKIFSVQGSGAIKILQVSANGCKRILLFSSRDVIPICVHLSGTAERLYEYGMRACYCGAAMTVKLGG